MDTPDPQNTTHPNTPAGRAIAAFGGARPLAKAIGRDFATVYKWTYAEDKGGTGGVIPFRSAQRIYAEAKARGIPLTMSDLVDPPAPPAPSAAEGA
jgi:hypothetical protein